MVSNFNSISTNSIFNFFGGAIISLMCIFPNAAYLPKIIILGIIFYQSIKNCPVLSKNVIFFWAIYLLAGWYGIINGLMQQTEHPFNWITTVMIWPTLCLPIIACINTNIRFIYLTRLLFWIHTFIVCYDLMIALSVIFQFPMIIIYTQDTEIFSYYPEINTFRMNLVNLNVLNFTFPVILLCWLSNYDIKVNSKIIFFTIILSFVLLFISGRRSVMLLSIIVIPIAIIFSKFLPYNNRLHLYSKSKYLLLFICLILIIVGIANFGIIEGFMDTFLKAFDSGKEPIKFVQQKMLLDNFFENPIFGAGVGKEFFEPFPGRNYYNYQFELQYHLILAQMGIIGFILYMIVYLGIFLFGLYLTHKNRDVLFFFYLVGYFFILISHATNPVLCSFDLMLPFFICLAKINYNSHNKKITV